MPNWVSCELKITGNDKEINRFIKFAKSKNKLLDMNKFIPYPKKYSILDKLAKKSEKIRKRILDYIIKCVRKITEKEYAYLTLDIKNELFNYFPIKKDGYNSGGYEWCVNNWGTKWNFSNTCIRLRDKNFIHYSFQTPWNIPEPVLLKMSKLFPELTFNLFADEEGGFFVLDIEYQNGKIMKKIDLTEEYNMKRKEKYDKLNQVNTP